jgi:hypothetical protein
MTITLINANTYTQNFNTLAKSDTSSTLPTGWLFTEASDNANTTYTGDNGSSKAGDTYSYGEDKNEDTDSYGEDKNEDRALGTLRSGNLSSTIGASFTNNTGTTITALAISYTGEQWRRGSGTERDRLDFQYLIGSTSLTDTNTWTDVNELDFLSPIATGKNDKQTDGNATGNNTEITYTITNLSIGPGETFVFRWLDIDVENNDDGLAVDDFNLTPILGSTSNNPLMAVADNYSTNEDTSLTVNSANGVLSNDTDLEGDSLTVTFGNPSNGSLSSTGNDGRFVYTPNPNFNGTDSFTYNATDSGGLTSSAVVTITVNSVDDLPTAENDSANTDEDTTVTIDVLNNDDFGGDGPGTVDLSFTQGNSGTVTILNGVKGNPTKDQLVYTPNANFNGTDSFSYTITDSDGDTDSATVTITVEPDGGGGGGGDLIAPIIKGPSGNPGDKNSVISIAENITFVTDIDVVDQEETVTWSIVGRNDGDFFTIEQNGKLYFKTAPNFENPLDTGKNNIYEVTVRVLDKAGNASTQAVTITVTDVNEVEPDTTPPVIPSGQTFSYRENSPVGTIVARVEATDNVGVTGFQFANGKTISDGGYYQIDNNGTIRLTSASIVNASAPVGIQAINGDGIGTGIAENDFETLPNTFALEVQAIDEAGNISPGEDISLNVLDVDDTGPKIQGPRGNFGDLKSATSVPENNAFGADMDADKPVDWSIIGGEDAERFSIDINGVVSFNELPDFEAPIDVGRNNTYIVTVQAMDNNRNLSSQTVTITVTDVLEVTPDTTPPVITGSSGLPGAASSTKSIPENTSQVAQLTANETVTWSINNGADGNLFTIEQDGKLGLIEAPDFENPKDVGLDNAYIVVVDATDLSGNVSSQVVVISVTDVDEGEKPEAPELTPVYRLWNGKIGDHFYTINQEEALIAAKELGYTFEGVAFDAVLENGTAVYRNWNGVIGDHFYTSNLDESNNGISNGDYQSERVGFSVDNLTGQNIYRLWNRSINDHFYTAFSEEAQAAEGIGYMLEGVDFKATTNNAYVFNGYEYLASYGDLIQAFGNSADTGEQAEVHYLTYGIVEGRSYDTFNNEAYLAVNPDVAAHSYYGQNPAEHYVCFGFAEGRSLG